MFQEHPLKFREQIRLNNIIKSTIISITSSIMQEDSSPAHKWHQPIIKHIINNNNSSIMVVTSNSQRQEENLNQFKDRRKFKINLIKNQGNETCQHL